MCETGVRAGLFYKPQIVWKSRKKVKRTEGLLAGW